MDMLQKFKAAEEEDSDLLTLSLSSSSSSSSLNPNSLPAPLLSLSFPSIWFPSSSSSSSSLNLQYSYPTQNLEYPLTLFSPPSSTQPLLFHNPQQQLFTDQPAPLLPTAVQPSSILISTTPCRRRGPSLQSRIPQNPNHGRDDGKSEIIPPPFPWAKDRRAMIHSLGYLRENKIWTISGTVHCKTCENNYEIGFDLEAKFAEVSSFIAMNKHDMHNRAPNEWLSPILPICKNCGNSVRPVFSKKISINWLFLFLGQMLGCCTLEQLKYYCKHTGNFRTASKDRILYITYLEIHEQLGPTGS